MTTRDPNTVTDIAQARRKAFGENQEMVADMLLHESPLNTAYPQTVTAIPHENGYGFRFEAMPKDEMIERVSIHFGPFPGQPAPRIGGWKFWTVQIVGWAALAAGLWWAVRS